MIVGAGPAGLAAAVYAASEGLDALVIEAISGSGRLASWRWARMNSPSAFI